MLSKNLADQLLSNQQTDIPKFLASVTVPKAQSNALQELG